VRDAIPTAPARNFVIAARLSPKTISQDWRDCCVLRTERP